MNYFQNLDLLFVGMALAANGVLGFTVLLSNTKSQSNRAFFTFVISTIPWGILNYFVFQPLPQDLAIWVLRGHVFFAVLYCFFLSRLFHIFPREKTSFPKIYYYLTLPAVSITAILTLTPLVFEKVLGFSPAGGIEKVSNGYGLVIFGIVVLALIAHSVYSLCVRLINTSNKVEKSEFKLLLAGVSITFILHIVFNLVLPTIFSNPRFAPFGSLYIFPFILFTSYAILKHKLFNIRVAGVSILVFLLSITSFIEVVLANNTELLVYRSAVLLLVLIFGIMLIKGVLREVQLREELEVANKQQESLIHFISHEVKGFLSKSRGIFSMIKEGDYGPLPEYLKVTVEEGLNSGKKGVDMVQDILSASNLKKGTMAYKMENFDLKPLLDGTISELKSNAEARGLSLETKISNDNFEMMGDKEQIKHVLKNLIDNSIKYTQQGGLMVGLSKNNDKILFSVKDTGVGINPEDEANLFTEGVRGKDSLKINVDSTGYGLYITKKIVEAHHGRIWYESAGPGKGTTFYAEFPTK